MLICGIKLTHDGSVAVIDTEPDIPKLLFSTEMEKLENGPRYAKIVHTPVIEQVLNSEGLDISDIDEWVLDGWKHGKANDSNVEFYHEFEQGAKGHLLTSERGGVLDIGAAKVVYTSYRHMAAHVVGTYVTSPFGVRCEPAYVITWDGGQNPRVYRFDPESSPNAIYVDTIMEFYGIIYSIMGYYYGPYKNPMVMIEHDIGAHNPLYGGYETPGKLMSYIALGKVDTAMLDEMHQIYRSMERHRKEAMEPHEWLGYQQNGIFEHKFMREVQWRIDSKDDATVLRTLHTMLSNLLVSRAMEIIPKGSNLLFTGGSALNIKWNSALRDSGHFAHVWVPPFPNDTGTALGAAACRMIEERGCYTLDWSVYAGPKLLRGELSRSQQLDSTPRSAVPMTPAQLGEHIANNPSEPVVVLHGRAEIGPRALGNRSILAVATDFDNKARLNAMKRREDFRPVAPLCMEEHAEAVFMPGTPDPYMLFEHVVRPEWEARVPAVVHLDKTARLQTINAEQNPVVHEVLSAYHAITGVPLLCNTSANFNGCGFFPDVASALRWAGTKYVWAEGVLYETP